LTELNIRILGLEEWQSEASEQYTIEQLTGVFYTAFEYGPKYQQIVQETIKRELRQGYIYLVMLVDNLLTGFICYRVDNPRNDILAELFHLANEVSPGLAGGGRKLIQAMEDDLRQRYLESTNQHLHCIYLRTHLTNHLAQNTYRRCGFRLVAMLPSHFHNGVDELVFQKLYNAGPEVLARQEQWSKLIEAQLAVYRSDEVSGS
jgi:RimJ/RimL family protein N-acetyltransferase